ncbi:hypothetical protein CCMA1212_008370 [Trichoderma ghanense]|uniref:Uncharacterized protein n=1 Tax=Trichoderma ghanense TaxID=65468 RepID=A0ABY2GVG7_9HYPO
MEPHYVVISPGFEGGDAQPLRWLGRIVARMEAPSQKYAPFKFDMVPILTDYMLQPVHDLDAVVFAKGIRNKRFQLDMMKWVQATAETSDENSLRVKSPKIATISLQQPAMLLEDMKGRDEVLNEMLTLLSQSGRKGYMIVGVKMLYKAVVSLGARDSRKREIEATVPLVEAVMGATGAAFAPFLVSNPRGAISSSSEHSRDVLYAFERPRIFALEYREVAYKKSIFKDIGSLIISVDAPTYKKDHHVFGDNKKAHDVEQPTQEDDFSVQESTISAGDVNDGCGWGESRVNLQGNECASCVLIHEVKAEEED